MPPSKLSDYALISIDFDEVPIVEHLNRSIGADNAWDFQLSADYCCMREHTSLIGDNRRSFPAERHDLRRGALGNENISCLHSRGNRVDLFHISKHWHNYCLANRFSLPCHHPVKYLLIIIWGKCSDQFARIPICERFGFSINVCHGVALLACFSLRWYMVPVEQS